MKIPSSHEHINLVGVKLCNAAAEHYCTKNKVIVLMKCGASEARIARAFNLWLAAGQFGRERIIIVIILLIQAISKQHMSGNYFLLMLM